MIWTFVQKDFARVRRNPWGVLVSLAMPLMVTALIGFIFRPEIRRRRCPGDQGRRGR